MSRVLAPLVPAVCLVVLQESYDSSVVETQIVKSHWISGDDDHLDKEKTMYPVVLRSHPFVYHTLKPLT